MLTSRQSNVRCSIYLFTFYKVIFFFTCFKRCYLRTVSWSLSRSGDFRRTISECGHLWEDVRLVSRCQSGIIGV